MKNEITPESVIGQVVANDYRTAEVFARHGIDFCCKGELSIGEACSRKNAGSADLISDLNRAGLRADNTLSDYKSWPIDLLADYIEKKHHRYVAEKTPLIQQCLSRICALYGESQPELLQIAEEFSDCASALQAHMTKEELILFPFIRKLVTDENIYDNPGAVENPIDMMKHEHEMEGERFERIARLSNNYTPPPYTCVTYRVTFALLKEFEQDLLLHIHLENNILFRRALEMESQMNAKLCQAT